MSLALPSITLRPSLMTYAREASASACVDVLLDEHDRGAVGADLPHEREDLERDLR